MLEAHHPRRPARRRPVQGLGQQRQRGRPLGPRRRPAAGRELRRPHADLRSPLERYAATYERKTWDWKDAADIAGADRRADRGPRRREPERQQRQQRQPDPGADVPGPELRHRRGCWTTSPSATGPSRGTTSSTTTTSTGTPRGRWSLVPWDLDREFGENFGWNARKSFFIGERGDPDGRNGEWNRIKDAFIRAYRTELLARLDYLATDDPASSDPTKGVLSPRALPGGRWTPPRPSSTPPTGAPPRSPACATSTPRGPACSSSATSGTPRCWT